MEGGEISQVTEVHDPQITTVETIITNDDLESDAVGEVIEAETYTDDFEVYTAAGTSTFLGPSVQTCRKSCNGDFSLGICVISTSPPFLISLLPAV